MRTLTFVVASGCVALATACSQSSAPRGIACPTLALEAPQLLYPIPDATGVPTAAASLVVAGLVPATAVVELVPQAGTTLALGTPGAPPVSLPSPEATPLNPDAPLHGVPYPALAAATTYTVTFHGTARVCPLPIVVTASFTTQ